MQRLTTLLLLAGITFTVQAQIIDAYQPDSDGDGCIGSADLIAFLAVYGTCEVTEFACGDPLTFDNHVYATVLIGGQCWFSENLQTQSFADGTTINAVATESDVWSEQPLRSVYGSDWTNCQHYLSSDDACDPSWSLLNYGRLYNQHAVNNPANLCPAGWHVPSLPEFEELIALLGEDEEYNSWALASSDGWDWYDENFTSDVVGFSAKPAGFFEGNAFDGAGIWTTFWTTSPGTDEGSQFGIEILGPGGLGFYEGSGTSFFSVRCIQD